MSGKSYQNYGWIKLDWIVKAQQMKAFQTMMIVILDMFRKSRPRIDTLLLCPQIFARNIVALCSDAIKQSKVLYTITISMS